MISSATTRPPTTKTKRIALAISSARKLLGATLRHKALSPARRYPISEIAAHTANARPTSGSIATKPEMRSARLAMPSPCAEIERSRSRSFSTVTTPETRPAIASARAMSSWSGTTPVSETTPCFTSTLISASAGSSAKIPSIRPAMRASAPASCVSAICWAGDSGGAGSALSDGAVGSMAAPGVAIPSAIAASKALIRRPPSFRRSAKSGRSRP